MYRTKTVLNFSTEQFLDNIFLYMAWQKLNTEESQDLCGQIAKLIYFSFAEEIIYGLSARVEVDYGIYNKAFELALISTKCYKITDKQSWKGMYIFGASEDPCSTVSFSSKLL